MKSEFPAAVPEIPVSDMAAALEYYANRLGFTVDWGGEGIAGISRGNCRLFLTNATRPVVIWLNLDSTEDVDELHDEWRAKQVKILSPPERKAWGLHEFTAADLDGNAFRVFYDFATPERQRA